MASKKVDLTKLDPSSYLVHKWEFDPNYRPDIRADSNQGLRTRALHAGYDPVNDIQDFRAFVPPLVSSVTFPIESYNTIPPYIYGRCHNPTVHVLEERLAALESAEAGLAAASGSQALFNLVLSLTSPGDNIVCSLNVFGEGYSQAARIFPKHCGVEFRFVSDPGDPDSWSKEIDRRTRLVWVETPSNPCLYVTDIAAVAQVAHAQGVPLLVDNTTATAALQNPMQLGADIILLSITKFLCGNASILGGAILGPSALIRDIRFNMTEFIGAVMQPFEAWLAIQSLETLPIRMKVHSENALQVAQFLENHPKVLHVNYPMLGSHPQHELAARQMKAGSGLLSFVVAGGMEGALNLMTEFKLIVHAVTFGTSRSICMHPATLTHQDFTAEERAKAGIADGLIRLSIGLEDPQDILVDLDQALAKA